MVNFKEKLFPRSKSHDGRDSSLSRKSKESSPSKYDELPSSSRSYSSTKTFSIFGRSPSPSKSPSPTLNEQQFLRSRSRNTSGTSSTVYDTVGPDGRNSSTSLVRSRSATRSPALYAKAKSPSPSASASTTIPGQVSLWNWKIEEPSLRSDEIDYREYKECFGCKKPIYKDMIQLEALSKNWHPECFHCSACAKVLSPPEKFLEMNGKPYCEKDYNELFFPKCFVCTKTIFENEVVVHQKSYHPDCFTCRKCSQTLCPYTSNFIERNGSFYCIEDYHDLFSPKCYECDEPIRDQRNMTRALGTTYHREHFTCFECKNPLPGNNIWKKNGQFYCEEDYHKLFSPICAGCFEPIRHNGVIALEQNWHGDCCLRCNACQKILQPDTYIAGPDKKAYCRNDWVKLYGPRCAECRRPIFETLKGTGVIAMGLDWHPGCFRCYDCLTALDENTFYEFNGRPYCHEHYHSKTCVDCIKKAEQNKLARQASIDALFEEHMYGPSGKKEKKIKGGAASASTSGRTSRQESSKSRSMSPFRSKSKSPA